MRLNKLGVTREKFAAMVALVMMSLAAASCEKVWDGEGDCSRSYQVAFTYTRNMLGTNVFGQRVKSLSLFVFDQDGNLVASKTETGDRLAQDGYCMTLDENEIGPGVYDLIVWGGLADGDSFTLAGGDNPLTKEDLVCRMTRQYDDDGNAFSDTELNGLYHGMANGVEFPNVYGKSKVVATIDMMKDTNTFRIAIHQKNGRKLEADRFSFRITDRNGLLNYDNALLEDEPVVYREWTKKEGTMTDPEEGSRMDGYATDGSITTVVAELSVARLHETMDPVLLVEYEGRQEPVVNLRLMQLLEMAQGEAWSTMQFQDFLDRQDDYTMFFRVDDDNSWYMQGGIYVNGWRVIFSDYDL